MNQEVILGKHINQFEITDQKLASISKLDLESSLNLMS